MKGRKDSKAKAGGLDKKQQLTQKFGKRLKQLRLAKGFTAAELFAFEHGINRSQYIAYERGMDIRLTTLARICAAHGITLEQFFSEGFE